MGRWWEDGLVERLLRRKTLRMVAKEAQLEEEVPPHHQGESESLLGSATVIPEGAEAVPSTTRSTADAKKEAGLRRELSLFDIVAYGVGCTVGAGIYSLVGEGAKAAGPAVLFSFLLGAVSCVLTGLSYSELAALIPLSGSAYTYTMVTMGELPAWLVGWNLTLEYAISAAAIARSWASYVAVIFRSADAKLPNWVAEYPLAPGWTLSPLAALLVILCTGVLTCGVSASSRFNIVITVINMLVLTFVVAYGSTFVDPANWVAVNDSFVPYGAASITQAAGIVFFSFLGFDMVSSLAEEVKSPQVTMPTGIIASLAASACVYVAVCLVVTGMAPFPEFTDDAHIDSPLSYVFELHGASWAAILVAVGSVAGLTSAAFTCIMGQPRIFFRMARDGLLWGLFADVSPSTGVPIVGTWLTGIFTALVALFMPLDVLAEAISIGTLLAFCAVCGGVILLHLDAPSWLPGASYEGRHIASIPPPGPSLCASWLGAVSCCCPRLRNILPSSGPDGLKPAAVTDARPLTAPPRSPAVAWTALLFFALCMGAGFSAAHAPGWLTAVLFTVCGFVLIGLCLFPRHSIPGAPFSCPAVPLVPGLGIAINSVMMAGLPLDSWLRMIVWALIGGVVYWLYGSGNSILGNVSTTDSASQHAEEGGGSINGTRGANWRRRRQHKAGEEEEARLLRGNDALDEEAADAEQLEFVVRGDDDEEDDDDDDDDHDDDGDKVVVIGGGGGDDDSHE